MRYLTETPVVTGESERPGRRRGLQSKQSKQEQIIPLEIGSMAAIGSRLGLLLCLLLLHSVLGSSNRTVLLEDCSNRCESKFCREAPILRYGRYCGVFYSGCNGEAPCDGLDSCCKNHDYCITRTRNYLNVQCNQKLLSCLSAYLSSGHAQFRGTKCRSQTVVNTIDFAIKAGVWIGRRIPPQDLQNSSSAASTGYHGP